MNNNNLNNYRYYAQQIPMNAGLATPPARLSFGQWLMILFVTAVVSALVSGGIVAAMFFASGKKMEHGTPMPMPGPSMMKPPAASSGTANSPTVFANPTPGMCPVSGKPFNPAVSCTVNDKRYAFCCEKCMAKFLSAPDQFLPKDERSHDHNGQSVPRERK